MAVKINAGLDVDGNEITVGREDVYRMPPSSIIIDHNQNGRHDKVDADTLQALADDIEANGQLQPITGRKLPDNTVQVVAGYTRLQACLLLEKKDPNFRIKVIVAKINEHEAFLANVRENLHRASITPMDTAHNVKRLMDQYGYDKPKVAKFYGKSEAWVLLHENVLSMTKEVQKAVSNGAMTLQDAFKLRTVPEAEVSALAESLPIPVKKVVGPVKSLKKGKEAVDPATVKAEDTEAGVDDIKDMIADGPKAKKGEKAPKEDKKAATRLKQEKNKKVAELARKSGGTVARQAGDLVKLLKGRNDAISEAIVSYLKGKTEGALLLELLDSSEAPVCG